MFIIPMHHPITGLPIPEHKMCTIEIFVDLSTGTECVTVPADASLGVFREEVAKVVGVQGECLEIACFGEVLTDDGVPISSLGLTDSCSVTWEQVLTRENAGPLLQARGIEDAQYESALQQAIAHGDASLVELLFLVEWKPRSYCSKYVNVDDWCAALKHPEVLQALFHYSEPQPELQDLLAAAVARDHSSAAELILKKGVSSFLWSCDCDERQITPNPMYPLHRAIEAGASLYTIRVLLDDGASISAPCELWRTAVHCAVVARRLDVLELFLTRRLLRCAHFFSCCEDGGVVHHTATDPAFMKLMRTLHLAAWRMHEEGTPHEERQAFLRVLRHKGVWGGSVLDQASRGNNEECLALVMEWEAQLAQVECNSVADLYKHLNVVLVPAVGNRAPSPETRCAPRLYPNGRGGRWDHYAPYYSDCSCGGFRSYYYGRFTKVYPTHMQESGLPQRARRLKTLSCHKAKHAPTSVEKQHRAQLATRKARRIARKNCRASWASL